MASQSLYRKWRSQTFSDLVGQEPVIRTLKNALNSGNLTHAYLFTGPRGTGKTSTARLLAKTINCLHSSNGEPCNECQQCKEITAGNSFNVIEIDAASNRGIDSIRELREKVMVPPSTGKYKVYILDEAHMLTTEAFNALLKTLEEPPPHAIFVMATTDVHKMLPTVLSRCQRFDFKRITTRQIVEHLQFVAEQEQIKLDRGAAELIARAAAGGMRDALSLLDQAIAYSGQEVTLVQVQTMLGVADPRAIQKFITYIAHLDSAAGLHLIHDLVEAGADLRQINSQVAEYLRAMMLARAGANIAAIVESPEDELREIAQTAQLFGLEELTECARVFAQNDLMQKSLGAPQLGLELALLVCIELHRRVQAGISATPLPSVAQLVHPVSPVQPSSAPVQEPPRIQNSTVSSPSHAKVEIHTPPSAVTTPAVPPVVNKDAAVSEDLPDWDAVSYLDDEGEPEPAPSVSPVTGTSVVGTIVQSDHVSVASHESNALTLQIEQVRERWEYVKRRVRTRKDGAKIAALLNGYTLTSIEGTDEQPVVFIKAQADFHYKSMQKNEDRESIEWALKIELGRECRVRLLPPGNTGSSLSIPPPQSSVSHDDSSRLSNTATTVSSQQSAYRERPLPEKTSALPPRQEAPQKKTAPPPADSRNHQPPPLARTNIVRENTSRVSSDADRTLATSETRQQQIERKAKNDPVVQEAVRMFKAEIKDIHFK